jgi:hypothetical protein
MKEPRDVVDYCSGKKKQLILVCDASAHHILWEATISTEEEKA